MELYGFYSGRDSPASPLGGARPPCPIFFSGDDRRSQEISEILALDLVLEIAGNRGEIDKFGSCRYRHFRISKEINVDILKEIKEINV
eukprot:6433260-Prymnesium_polylepis.1